MKRQTKQILVLINLSVLFLATACSNCDPDFVITGTGKTTCLQCPSGQPLPAEKLQACQLAKDDAESQGKVKCTEKCPVLKLVKTSECSYATAPVAGTDQWETVATLTNTYHCCAK